ncbi:MAG: DUF3775 domain-containing protein [Marinovum algicola]|uniref:DUF3775 domain-containing protein n=1 Tax=Marinovum algicola TaxID=42444 RepID=UPI0032EDE305
MRKNDMVEHVVELNIDPQAAFYILVKAREFDEKAGDTGAELDADDEDASTILLDRPGDPTYQELMTALKELNIDEQMDLIVLMWVGRGDFEIDEWETARRQALEMSDKHIPQYLSTTPLLSDYLAEGLNRAGYAVDEFELGRF